MKRIIEFVNQKWHAPIFLIGHSAGTTSVAHVAASLKDQRIGGIVLTGAPSLLARLPLHDIAYLALFVHHRNDTCASFDAALQQKDRLINSPRVGFIEVWAESRGATFVVDDPMPLRHPPIRRSGRTILTDSPARNETSLQLLRIGLDKPVPDRIGP